MNRLQLVEGLIHTLYQAVGVVGWLYIIWFIYRIQPQINITNTYLEDKEE